MMGPSYNKIFVGSRVFNLMKSLCHADGLNANALRVGAISFVLCDRLEVSAMCTDDPKLVSILEKLEANLSLNATTITQYAAPPIK